MTTWPTLPAASSKSFLDHFPGASLDGRWTAVTGTGGAVTVTDSYVDMTQTAAAGSAAFIYYNTQLDKSKSQLWLICMNRITTGPNENVGIHLMNGSSVPAADTLANINARLVIGSGRALQDTYCVFDDYFDNVGTRFFWDTTLGTWGAYGVSKKSVLSQPDDYTITGIEFDGPNQRWRILVWGQAFATAGTFTANQGWRLFSLTDWVTWANTRSSANLWLMFGMPITDNAEAAECKVEWVRYCEAPAGNAVVNGWAAATSSGSFPQVRHVYSHDGYVFVPEDRASWALALGAGSPDNQGIGEPWVVYDGVSTDYMFYDGTSGATVAVCVASAPHTTPQNGPWTRFGSNPIISMGGSGADDESQISQPIVVCDMTDSDSSKRWKMLYSGKKVSDSKWRILYATASSPTGTWTKQGTVLDVGAGGSDDENAVSGGILVAYNGQWELYYSGWDSSNLSSVMRATASAIGGTWTKTGTIFKMPVGGTRQSLTANLNTAPGRNVTVADTTGFQVDATVILSQSTTQATYSTSKVRKIVSGTVLELYHGLTGFLTTYPAKVKQTDTGPNIGIRVIAQVGSEWWFYMVLWEPWLGSTDTASYANQLEEMHLYKHSNVAPSGTTPLIQYQPSPVVSRGFNSDLNSFENMSVRLDPFYGFTTPSIIAIHGNIW